MAQAKQRKLLIWANERDDVQFTCYTNPTPYECLARINVNAVRTECNRDSQLTRHKEHFQFYNDLIH